MGRLVVSPATHTNDCGRFRASFSIHRFKGNGNSHRVFHFDKAFASREAAQIFAVTQGWLRACIQPVLAC
ncbi:hypothetical protein [Variovorax sp.]|uniref:hypothetical protein n=1 Tax=unclassified Variovorax TaxID=663243 RepID=UPI0012174C56|nr:hypothetical protein [Variovorax sp.]TAJ64854.1 MAG: hypothetical protein EPO53_10935 [Variovorax sp.]